MKEVLEALEIPSNILVTTHVAREANQSQIRPSFPKLARSIP
jgi:hypothetical protein